MASDENILDVRGLLCPLPVLKARKRLGALPPGAVLRVEATDPASVIDVPHFCSESGHELLDQSEEDGVFTFRIRRS
ncbi:sulfurtransferase TusA family protein [Kaustia mangrovi]|uniref:Sulfurtransferase TusA family protein n=1 Tax=Kaustia mangrovi TaxID=2593653 RepID=A0A7S8HCG9_9HYPH|nr:sulfurtransferase TusA family protein [Kaustia mangrovi]QPC43228.1 sulfurtransferase TusA family protein [Kaustia mangrovi]